MADRLTEIKGLQKQIVGALEQGRDVAELSRRLAQVRSEIAQEAELEELRKVAMERADLRLKAAAVTKRIEKQAEAIAAFLEARDRVTAELGPVWEKARTLIDLQAKCYEQFRPGALAWAPSLPESSLPEGLLVPGLEGADKVNDPNDRAAQAAWYIGAGLGLLQSLQRVDRPFPSRPMGEWEGELGTPEPNCLVCGHEKVGEINKALQGGRSLRDIEAEFGTSRSTLSRHKNKCLNLGVIWL